MRRNAGCQMTYPQLLLARRPTTIAERTNLISLSLTLVMIMMMIVKNMVENTMVKNFAKNTMMKNVMKMRIMIILAYYCWRTLSQKEPISSVSSIIITTKTMIMMVMAIVMKIMAMNLVIIDSDDHPRILILLHPSENDSYWEHNHRTNKKTNATPIKKQPHQ